MHLFNKYSNQIIFYFIIVSTFFSYVSSFFDNITIYFINYIFFIYLVWVNNFYKLNKYYITSLILVVIYLIIVNSFYLKNFSLSNLKILSTSQLYLLSIIFILINLDLKRIIAYHQKNPRTRSREASNQKHLNILIGCISNVGVTYLLYVLNDNNGINIKIKKVVSVIFFILKFI